MALALGPWTRAAVVLVAPLILFAGVAVAVDLIDGPPPPAYYETPAYLPLVICPNNTTSSPFTQSFHGVAFNLTVVDECTPAGPWLTGNVTEPNGTTFHLGLWSLAWGNRTWYSPDHYCGVKWVGGVNEDVVILYVRS